MVVSGIVHDQVYFRERVEPHMRRDWVIYLGSVGPDERARVLGGSAAPLFRSPLPSRSDSRLLS